MYTHTHTQNTELYKGGELCTNLWDKMEGVSIIDSVNLVLMAASL